MITEHQTCYLEICRHISATETKYHVSYAIKIAHRLILHNRPPFRRSSLPPGSHTRLPRDSFIIIRDTFIIIIHHDGLPHRAFRAAFCHFAPVYLGGAGRC